MANLGRKLRRQQERQQGINAQRQGIKRVLEQRQHDEKFTSQALEIMYYMLGLAVHEGYGFGQKRLYRLFKRYDEMVVAEEGNYIDCLYIIPEHRNQGYGTKLVKEYCRTHTMPRFLHIINDNEIAYKFWNKLFNLIKWDETEIDTLYKVINLKGEI